MPALIRPRSALAGALLAEGDDAIALQADEAEARGIRYLAQRQTADETVERTGCQLAQIDVEQRVAIGHQKPGIELVPGHGQRAARACRQRSRARP